MGVDATGGQAMGLKQGLPSEVLCPGGLLGVQQAEPGACRGQPPHLRALCSQPVCSTVRRPGGLGPCGQMGIIGDPLFAKCNKGLTKV